MRSRHIRQLPTVLLAVLVLLIAAALTPIAGGVLTDLDRAAGDGHGTTSGVESDRTGLTVEGLHDGTEDRPTLDHPGSSTVVSPVSDRIASPVDRITTFDWRPPVAVLLFGYTRQADQAPLDHDVRHRVFDQVRSTPGAHIAALADGTDTPRSTVRYHLRVLEDAGLIEGATIRGRHRYAMAGTDLELAAALYDEPTRAVLEAVARFEPVSVSGLAEEIDRAPSTVAHHLDGLEDAGILTRESAAGRVDVRLDGAAVDFEPDRPVVASVDGSAAELSVE